MSNLGKVSLAIVDAQPGVASAFTSHAFGKPGVLFYGQTPAVKKAEGFALGDVCGPILLDPSSDPEVIRWQHSQRVIKFAPTEETLAYITARIDVSDICVGVLERISTWIAAEALDEEGVPVTYFVCDGSDPTQSGEWTHPDPDVAPLRWGWRLVDLGYSMLPAQENVDGISPEATGIALIPTWQDGRYGWAHDAPRSQRVLWQETRAALFLTVSGGEYQSTPGWRISASGQLVGFTQLSGARDRAFQSITERS